MTKKIKKIYSGEIGELYGVKFKYNSGDSWLKRRFIDLYFWFIERLNEQK